MLLDDKKKLIEVYMENVLWGNVTLKAVNHESGFHIPSSEKTSFKSDLQQWCSFRAQKQTETEEFQQLTEKLYDLIVDYRIVGLIVGKFDDPDNTIDKLKNDNEKLTEHLSQAYIPPTDSKVGTS